MENNPRNLLTKLRGYERLVDGRNSLSCLEDVAAVVLFFIKNLPEPGIYNVCNTGSITTKEIIKLMGLVKKSWFTMKQFNAYVKAPRSFCTLNTDKLSAIYPMRSVEEALHESISGGFFS